MHINIFSKKSRFVLIALFIIELVILFGVDTGKLQFLSDSFDNTEPNIGRDIGDFKKIETIDDIDFSKSLRVNLGIEGMYPSIYSNLIAYYVSEEVKIKDYNNDLDKIDLILAYYNLTDNTETVLDLSGFNPSLFSDVVAFQSFYTDLSANTRMFDFEITSLEQVPTYIRYYNITSQVVYNTYEFGMYPHMVDSKIVFSTPEMWAGYDLNQDGDIDDNVIQYYDIVLRRTINTGIEGNVPKLYKNLIYFQTNEAYLGYDIDGDAFFDGVINAKYNMSSREILPIIGPIPNRYFHIFVYFINESSVGLDYNVDGDIDDFVILYYDAYNSYSFVVGVGMLPSIDDFRIVYNVYEAAINMDLNDDGDFDDFMIYMYPVPVIWPYQIEQINISLAGNVYIAKDDIV
ncbi:MAG: hypothetical protein K0B02_04885 [DPANN group archaeon]|nr:hypothetical protein [DPANN group archaeon]